MLSAIAEMPIGAFIAVAQRGHGATEFAARNACLAAVVESLQRHDVPRLVVESRDDDREDERHLVRVGQLLVRDDARISGYRFGPGGRCPHRGQWTGLGVVWTDS